MHECSHLVFAEPADVGHSHVGLGFPVVGPPRSLCDKVQQAYCFVILICLEIGAGLLENGEIGSVF